MTIRTKSTYYDPENIKLFNNLSYSCFENNNTPPITGLRLRSHLVPEHGARERFLMGTNVNTPFFQVPRPEFGYGTRARVQGPDLVLGH